jgi:predicted RNA-binding protein with RPS1 domain
MSHKTSSNILQKGAVVEGTVAGFADYGAFVNLGTTDGLLHVKDISWAHIDHPSEKLSIGDKVRVLILDYNEERGRISLGLKQLAPSPWDNISDRFPVGKKVTGTVSNLTDYGAFVCIEDGIEGLVHVSEMCWTNANIRPSTVVKLGQEVDVVILDVQESKNRLSLSMKQTQNNPWITFKETYNDGSQVIGNISSIADFGLFIKLPGGIDGLVRLTNILQEKYSSDELESVFSIGQQIKVKVLDIDAEKKRIGLSIQQSKDIISVNNIVKKDAIVSTAAQTQSIDTRLLSVLKDYLIFVDTCSLMEGSSKEVFSNDFCEQLVKNNRKIKILDRVLVELNNHINSNHVRKNQLAVKGIQIIEKFKKFDCVDIIEVGQDPNKDPIPDELFQSIFVYHRSRNKICLITQDVNLSHDVLALNSSRSTGERYGKKTIKGIKVFRIDGQNKLKEFYSDIKDIELKDKRKDVVIKPFKKVADVNTLNKSIVVNSLIPESSDFVKTLDGKNIYLYDEIATGGEGKVYSINDTEVCKIYKKDKLLESSVQKLKLMTSNKVEVKGVCWPKSIVYNANNEPVGHLMNKAQGVELARSIFQPKLLGIRFPTWDRKSLVKICVKILDKIIELHQYNIIIGDINGQNIMVTESLDVYFVDTDSFQVEGYPCPVGLVLFTAPEIQGINFKSFLRTVENENFAIATLLFMILMPGKPPYSHQGGTTIAENIKKGEFSYPLHGKKYNKQAPKGPWRFMWSHLPHKVKMNFNNIFSNGERISAPEWRKILDQYVFELSKEYHSTEIFPTEFKHVDNETKQKYNV